MNKPYEPKPCEVAGFELCGWRLPNGKILLGSKEHGTLVDEWPKEVRLVDAVYTLEDTEWQENGFGWGFYV